MMVNRTTEGPLTVACFLPLPLLTVPYTKVGAECCVKYVEAVSVK